MDFMTAVGAGTNVGKIPQMENDIFPAAGTAGCLE